MVGRGFMKRQTHAEKMRKKIRNSSFKYFSRNVLGTIFTYGNSEIQKRGNKNDIFNQRSRLLCMTLNFKNLEICK